MIFVFFFFKQKTAYEMRISDWSSDVCSSDLHASLLRIRLDLLAASADSEAISAECNSEDANEAARNGHLDAIRELRAHGIHCTVVGADWAASDEIGRASCRERVCQYV